MTFTVYCSLLNTGNETPWTTWTLGRFGMNKLEQIIIDRIKGEGPIPFETFMDMALYYPELGYYTSPDLTIGPMGDFYTGPHLHPILGAMIGRQLEEMWESMGRPPDFHAVEIGAGAGYLCRDVLSHLRNSKIFDSLHYTIVEINPAMAARQQALVRDFREKIRWISSITELKGIRGCIFSNELLDAFPVHVVQMGDEIREIYVSYDKNRLKELYNEVSTTDIIDYLNDFQIKIPPGCRSEVNLRIRKWLRQTAGVLSEGFILSVDYGYSSKEYYDEERSGGTLLCYHKHLFHESPFDNIGL